jgi:hypothetical protein
MKAVLSSDLHRARRTLELRAHGTRAPPERLPHGNDARGHMRDQILFRQYRSHRPRPVFGRCRQLRQENARAQRRAFLNANVVFLEQPDVGGDHVIPSFLPCHGGVKTEAAGLLVLVEADVAELDGRLRPVLRNVRHMAVLEQVNVGRLRPMAALQLKADRLADGQKREIVLPDFGAGKIDSLTVLGLDKAGAAGGAHVLDPANHLF